MNQSSQLGNRYKDSITTIGKPTEDLQSTHYYLQRTYGLMAISSLVTYIRKIFGYHHGTVLGLDIADEINALVYT